MKCLFSSGSVRRLSFIGTGATSARFSARCSDSPASVAVWNGWRGTVHNPANRPTLRINAGGPGDVLAGGGRAWRRASPVTPQRQPLARFWREAEVQTACRFDLVASAPRERLCVRVAGSGRARARRSRPYRQCSGGGGGSNGEGLLPFAGLRQPPGVNSRSTPGGCGFRRASPSAGPIPRWSPCRSSRDRRCATSPAAGRSAG